MLTYFFKRLLLFVPTLLIISLLIFFLSKAAAGDPLLDKLEREAKEYQGEALERIIPLKKKLGLDLPHFYFGLHRQTACPYPNEIPSVELLKSLEALAFEIGSWEKVEAHYRQLMLTLKQEQLTTHQRNHLKALLFKKEKRALQTALQELKGEQFDKLKQQVDAFQAEGFHANNYLLQFQWNGSNNQYHNWMKNILRGQLGNSYQDGRSVSEKVYGALQWTLILSTISLILALAIAIPTAVYSAARPGGKLDRFCSTLFFGFYALPTFWVASLLIVFFASGTFVKWFPTYGLGQLPPSASFFELLSIRSSHLFLPIVCCTYASLAYVYRQLRSSMQQQLAADYIQTALSKGVPQHRLLWRHAFKNASFPLITLLGSALPMMVSGAFVVEYIFAIPGMGKLTVDSFLARDFPVIFAIVLLIFLLTLIGSWLSDVAYHIADPRFQINTSKR